MSGFASKHTRLDDRQAPFKAVLPGPTAALPVETPRTDTKICPGSYNFGRSSGILLLCIEWNYPYDPF